MAPTQTQRKADRVVAALRSYGRVAVAFSAGVDSTVVCKAAQLADPDGAVAVTARSASVPEGEVEEAARLARLIGIRHIVIDTQEFDNADYTSNPTDRCRYCKTELYSQMQSLLPKLDADVIVNGTNTDDQDDYRPGLQAAAEFSVRSPLTDAGCNKSDVRKIAELWGLDVWDKPASPCLSSRVAYGVEVTAERLRRVDTAEQFVRKLIDERVVRVRCEKHDHARIEVPVVRIPDVHRVEATVRDHLVALGFRSVAIDPEGFRSGSMNEGLGLVPLQIPASE